MSKSCRRALLVLTGTLAASGTLVAGAHAAPSAAQAQSAEAALERVEDVLNGTADAHDATLALRELAQERRYLTDAGDRRQAARYFARPTDGDQSAPDPQDRGYTVAEEAPFCSANFCVHYVASTDDAPEPDDADADGVPDYVQRMSTVFEVAFQKENVDLGWRAAPSDGTRGGDGRVDVYVKDLPASLYGFVATDPGQSGSSQTSFQVMDDDYASFGDPVKALEATAAHEYNHILQNGYDANGDAWFFESTATWMEDQVFPANDTYIADYLPTWAEQSEIPVDRFDSATNRQYGSGVLVNYLAATAGTPAVRGAWERLAGVDHEAVAALRDELATRSRSLAGEFAYFAAATAFWREERPSFFSDGPAYPEVLRYDAVLIPDDATASTLTMDHLTFGLYDVAVPSGQTEPIELVADFPAGVDGFAILAGLKSDGTVDFQDVSRAGAQSRSQLSSPAQYERVTAVLVNGDASNTGLTASGDDYVWSADGQRVTFEVQTVQPPLPPVGGEPVPDSRITSGPPASTSATSAQFAFTATPSDGVTFTCQVDSGPESACTSPKTVSGLAPGQHTIRVRATRRGAVEPDSSRALRSWTVVAPDSTPPVTTIQSGPKSLANSTSASFKFTANEPATFRCQVDSQPVTDCNSGSASYSALGQGTHTFRVTATDKSAARNVAAPVTSTWTVDTVAPGDFTVRSVSLASGRAEFSFTGSESAARYECFLDTGAPAACTSPVVYTGVSAGTHQVTVRAFDAAGNSRGKGLKFTMPPTPPAPPVASASGSPVAGPPAPAGFVAPAAAPPAPGLTIAAPKGLKLAGLLRSGVLLPVTVARAATVRATLTIPAKAARKLRLGKKATVVGSGTAKVTKSAKLKLTIARKAKSKLRRAKGVKATLTLVATTADGARQTIVRTVTLK